MSPFLCVEGLEDRSVLSSVSFVAGTLSIQGDANDNLVFVQVNPADSSQLQVNVDGTLQVFPVAQVQLIQAFGQAGNDILTVQAPAIPTVLDGGQGQDNLWTFGSDTLLGGQGQDVLYSIIGASVIDGGQGRDRQIGNVRSSFGNDAADRPNVVFGQAQTDAVQLIAGIVYVAGTPGDDRALVADFGSRVIVQYNGQTFQFARQNVDQIVGLLGAGNDSFLSISHTDMVFYGTGGADTLVGGLGDDILKGGGGNDLIYGGAGNNDITGDGGADVLFGNFRGDVVRSDAADTVLSGLRDIQVSIAMNQTKR